MDDPDTPTIKERYLSEAYYAQTNTRLKIVRPFKLEFVPASKDAEAVAAAQRAAAPKILKATERDPEPIALFAITRSQWSSHPDLAAFLADPPQAEVTILPKEFNSSLWKINLESKWGAPTKTRFGIAQPMKYPETKGMLFGVDPERYADAVVPLDCEPVTRVCHPLLEARGYYRNNYAMKHIGKGFKLAFTGALIEVRPGTAIYVRSLDQMLYVPIY